MFKCNKCGSDNIRFMTNFIVSAPIEFLRNFPKTAFRKKEVQILGASWDVNLDVYCMDCGMNIIDRHPAAEKYKKLKEELDKAENDAKQCYSVEEIDYFLGLKRAFDIIYGAEDG